MATSRVTYRGRRSCHPSSPAETEIGVQWVAVLTWSYPCRSAPSAAATAVETAVAAAECDGTRWERRGPHVRCGPTLDGHVGGRPSRHAWRPDEKTDTYNTCHRHLCSTFADIPLGHAHTHTHIHTHTYTHLHTYTRAVISRSTEL